MVHWQPYADLYAGTAHTVVGNVQVLRRFHSPELHNVRDIIVYLPPSYESSRRRYPVLYMHDGQNLFDALTSYSGEWQVDETMEMLAREGGVEAIVVGIPNRGMERIREYSPFRSQRFGHGAGERYIDFVAGTLKRRIDADFRTRPEREYTGLCGSSMGGLISLFGFFHRRDVFGFAGLMSPSLWFADDAIFDYVEWAPYVPGRLYIDAGTHELSAGGRRPRLRSRHYYGTVRRMYRRLVRKGYRPVHDVRYVEERLAQHREAAWARRLPEALRFLLHGLQ